MFGRVWEGLLDSMIGYEEGVNDRDAKLLAYLPGMVLSRLEWWRLAMRDSTSTTVVMSVHAFLLGHS